MVSNTLYIPARRIAFLLAPFMAYVVLVYLLCPTDTDFWWHLKMGQVILETRSIPREDIFSLLSLGKPMLAHEWGSEVIFALVYVVSGYAGLSLLFGLIAAFTLCVVYRVCRIRGIDALAAAIVAALAMRLTLVSSGVRPQIFTLLFTALVVWGLTVAAHRAWSRWLWAFPGMFCLWANMHGGYILGLVLLWVTSAAGWFCFERSLVRKLALLSAMCTVATLATPHGAHLWLYPLQYADLGSASLRYVTEWQSPNFHDPSVFLMVPVLLSMVVFGVRNSPSLPVDIVWTMIFTTMALLSSRHIPLFAIVVVPIVSARALYEIPAMRRWISSFDVRWISIALCALLPSCAVVAMNGSLRLHAGSLIRREPSKQGLPSGAVRMMMDSLPPGNLINEYDWGGFLIYSLYPRWHIGIDGRADVHGDATMTLNYQIFTAAPGWQQLVDGVGATYILVRKSGPLATALGSAPSWKLLFEGDVEMLFAREGAHQDTQS